MVTGLRALGRVCLVVVALAASVSCGAPPPSTNTGPGSSSPTPPVERIPAGATAWLDAAAVPFATDDPSWGLDDLEPLRQIVGDARVVSLGEATHGTNEFFRMKHRILRFLVERMGFTAFAIEATWPESNRLDRYVRTGEGDPEVLLSGLYFWTWNTREVLEMIRWMRSYNAAGGNVGFYGFDMQAPGMALDNVMRFIQAVDSGSTAEFTQHVDCLARFANDSMGRWPTPGYASQPKDYRDRCLADLRWAYDTIVERRAAYQAASSPVDWARAAQSARVAIQYEEATSNRVSRDTAMAENVGWLLDQQGPTGKMVLWAHNFHVSTKTGTMGQALRPTLGQSMLVVGFDFAHGSFTAYRMSGSTYVALDTMSVGDPQPLSYEDFFLSTRIPRFFLDLRNRDLQSADAAWLAGPRSMRSIGASYDPAVPGAYWVSSQLPRDYDVVIYFQDTSASELLPFRYPSTF